MDTPFTLAGRTFGSRLIVGTGKYPDFRRHAAVPPGDRHRAGDGGGAPAGPQGAGRRLDAELIDRARITLLPNTAGCYTADDAVRTCHRAEELGLSKWVKLEVLGDEKTLYPDVEQTLSAARRLVKEGFAVCPTPPTTRSPRASWRTRGARR